MAVFSIAMHGEPFDRLISDPEGAGLPGEAESAALYTDFELHVLWPQHGALHLIVEGDGEVDQLVALLTDGLAGGGWMSDVTRVPAAENPPSGLDAGAQSQWVIEQASPRGASEGETRVCDLCQWSAVPPHGPGCDAEKNDGGFAITATGRPVITGSGGGARKGPEPEPSVVAAPERIRATV